MCYARRVLVVEDTPALRHLLLIALTDEGYTVHTAHHGGHALRLLETLAPCLILLDLRLRVMDGYAFARAYRARNDADAPIIVMTAERRLEALDAINPVHIGVWQRFLHFRAICPDVGVRDQSRGSPAPSPVIGSGHRHPSTHIQRHLPLTVGPAFSGKGGTKELCPPVSPALGPEW